MQVASRLRLVVWRLPYPELVPPASPQQAELPASLTERLRREPWLPPGSLPPELLPPELLPLRGSPREQESLVSQEPLALQEPMPQEPWG